MKQALVGVVDRILLPLTAIGQAVQRVEIFVISAIAIIMVISTGWGVFSRYFLNRALPWPEEFGIFLYIWMCYIGSSVVLRRGKHIQISFFPERMPLFWRTLTEFWIYAIMLFFLIITVRYTYAILPALHTLQFGAALRWPKSYLSLSLLIAAAAMAVTCVQIMLQCLRDMLIPPTDDDLRARTGTVPDI